MPLSGVTIMKRISPLSGRATVTLQGGHLSRLLAAALLTAVAFALPGRAQANADCGPGLFPVTLTLDDPGVGDEAALPTVSYQHFGNNAATPGDDTTVSVNLNKRLTELHAGHRRRLRLQHGAAATR